MSHPGGCWRFVLLGLAAAGLLWTAAALATTLHVREETNVRQRSPVFQRAASDDEDFLTKLWATAKARRRRLALYGFLATVVALTLLVLRNSKIRAMLDAKLVREGSRVSRAELVATIGRRRVAVISTVLGVLVGGSMFDILTDTEHWPFSPYGMYSEVAWEHSVNVLRLVGVTTIGSEVTLLDPRYFRPFRRTRLQTALEQMNRAANRAQLLNEGLEDCLRRYERARREGSHDGPPLRALRLYRVVWKLDPWARNADRPDRKELLFEVRSPLGL